MSTFMSTVVVGARCLLVTLVTATCIVATGEPASAEQSAGARVTGVEERTVTITIPIPRESVIGTSPSLQATVEINGRVLPARPLLPAPDVRDRAVVMVLDASGSMSGRFMAGARQAAGAYLDALPTDVPAGLVTFADSPTVAAPVGTAHTAIEAALARVRASGGTSLYDAVRRGLELLPEDAEGRLLVLTDGEDTSSTSTLMAASRAARQRNVAVDVVLLGQGSRPVAEELAVSGSVTAASDARSLVSSFEQAALIVAPKVTVTAQVPEELDAAGARADVDVRGAAGEITATVVLPDVESLRGPDGRTAATARPTQQPPLEAGAVLGRDAVDPIGSSGPVAAVIALTVAGCVLSVGWLIQSMRSRRLRRRRVAQVLAYGSAWPRTGGRTSVGLPRTSVLEGWDRRIGTTRRGRALQTRLAAADLSVGVSAWLVAAGLAMGGTALLVWLIVDRLWLAALVALGLVPLAFAGVLRSRIGRRQKVFADELPEFLLLLSSALRAGLSFTQGLESAAEQHSGQVGRQIRRALAEAQVSANLDEALLASADRMGNEDLRWVVMALSVQREVGGNLSVILDTAATTIKGRHGLAREVRALSAEGRLSAYVLLALPVGVFVFLLMFRREYVSQLWTHPLGIAMMSALVILMVVGWIWMRAVVRIRV
jgi:tight adherence protein B